MKGYKKVELKKKLPKKGLVFFRTKLPINKNGNMMA